jgi:deoxycytidine triphosphate deaminase
MLEISIPSGLAPRLRPFMYLADRDIKAVLPDLGIETDHDDHSFDPDEQVQPCSIDLRVSDHFWKPSRRRYLWRNFFALRRVEVDLRSSEIHALDPRRDWRPVVLAQGDAITIKPGEILISRIYERFRMPADLAGKIEGRSSYARLGLMVHCTGDFINPGWNGYMPLQLYNGGPYPIRVTPFAPICQLMLVKLSSAPERTYGDEELSSKYVNDDGGPSFWWRDREVRRLQALLGERHAPVKFVQDVVEMVRFDDPEVLSRFQRFVKRQRVGNLDDADDVLTRFASRESWRRRIDGLCKAVFPLFAAATIGVFFVDGYWGGKIVLWVLTALSVVVSLYGFAKSDSDYLGTKELNAARALQRPTDAP